MNFRDVELLSEYLDGRLKPSEAARLEARLSSDPNLRATLADLRQTRGLLRRLPQRRAPRNFRLTPKMAGVRPPEPRSYPAFRLATALAAFLFLAAVAVNTVTPFAASHLAAAPAPAYGIGGGGGGGGEGLGLGGGGSGQFTEAAPAAPQLPAPTEAPAQTLSQLAPTPTPEGTQTVLESTEAPPPAQDATRASEAGPALTNKAAPVPPGSQAQGNGQPVPWSWVMGLGVAMVICGVAAWSLRRNNERHVRDQWNKK